MRFTGRFMSDGESGIDSYYFGTDNPSNENVDYTKITDTVVTKTISGSGTYYVVAKDKAGNVSEIQTITYYETKFEVKGATVEPTSIITLNDEKNITLPSVGNGITLNSDMNIFKGWYTDSNYSNNIGTTYDPEKDAILYGYGDKYTAPPVSKKANPISVSAITGLKYDGNDHTLVKTSGAKGIVHYGFSSINPGNYRNFGTSLPKKTNPGNYTVYYYAEGDTNYDVKIGSVSVTISCGNYVCPSGYKLYSSNKCCPTVEYGDLYYSGGSCVWTSDKSVDGLAVHRFAQVKKAQNKGYTTFVDYVRYTEYKNPDSFIMYTSYGERYKQSATSATCAPV